MRLKKMHWMGIIFASLIVLAALIFFLDDDRLLLFLVGIAFGIVALPFVIDIALENKKEQKINEMFLEFTRNLAESASAGTPVSKSIVNMRKKNYGVLNPHIHKLANQIEIGIPMDRAFQTFSHDVDSQVIKRALALIREAEKAGGAIDFILDSTAKSISEVEKLKKERRSTVYNLVVQGYIIFFVFIGIILVMEFKIIPLTATTQGLGDSGSVSADDFGGVFAGGFGGGADPEEFTKPFLYLLITQGLFVGLVIGKLTEGTLKAGVKHSFILVLSSFLISTGARVFFGSAT